VRLDLADDDVVCGEGRQMVFVDPQRLHELPTVRAADLVLPRVLAWRDGAARDGAARDGAARDGTEPTGQHRFAGVILVDRRGWLLLQERDEHPRIDPEKWGLAGGHLDPGEEFEVGAYRELEEETGVRLPPGTLTMWREFVVDHRQAYGTFDRMQVFVAGTDLTDDDIECHEGRQIVFVDADRARGLDLSSAASDIVPAFLDSDLYRDLQRPRQETP
jgi:8-oxo-dGTP pyrophosphatase MutT (NUDIX family)